MNTDNGCLMGHVHSGNSTVETASTGSELCTEKMLKEPVSVTASRSLLWKYPW